MESRVLALVGQRYCGKTTVADLVCQLDPRFHRMSFSSVLKKEYADKMKLDISKLSKAIAKDTYRQGMINESKKVKAEKGEDYYARTLFENVSPGKFIVIDDLRFIEELKYCLNRKAAIFRVHAEPHQRALRGYLPSEVDDDASETELAFLSAYDLWRLTNGRGGMFFNTRGQDYLKPQIIRALKDCFPPVVGQQYKDMMSGVV